MVLEWARRAGRDRAYERRRVLGLRRHAWRLPHVPDRAVAQLSALRLYLGFRLYPVTRQSGPRRAARVRLGQQRASQCRSCCAGCPWWPGGAARRAAAAVVAASSRRASTSPAATCLAKPRLPPARYDRAVNRTDRSGVGGSRWAAPLQQCLLQRAGGRGSVPDAGDCHDDLSAAERRLQEGPSCRSTALQAGGGGAR